jgi:hypothetical protein
MSLLMKALEKAAKDREGTDAERVTAAPAFATAKGGLELEPLPGAARPARGDE